MTVGLFAVILGYVTFRPPMETEPAMENPVATTENVAEYKAKAQTIGSGRDRRATAEDWAVVHAIAEEYAPQLAELEKQRDELKDGNEQYFNRGTLDKKSEWAIKQNEVVRACFAPKRPSPRDLEREQWARMGEYLSPYELRQYRMEHSFRGRTIKAESAWMQPPLDEGELVALLVKQEAKDGFLDREFDGQLWEMNTTMIRGWDKIRAIHDQRDKTWEEQRAEVQASTDPDILITLEHNDLLNRISRNTPALSEELTIRLAHGPQGQAVAEAYLEEEPRIRNV
ncbi:MAG: hypothetical protein M2R45_00319 [Verrucomicrobia subdivision 3 bacterium]|nr:hypothetical protein [Limisphaerales bacterium]MCS1412922.1 hypothetical protein [Limisphaerales bacterium]